MPCTNYAPKYVVAAGVEMRECKIQILVLGLRNMSRLQCVAVCCNVLQCVAVCCSVLQCVAVCCSVLQCVAVCCNDIFGTGAAECE